MKEVLEGQLKDLPLPTILLKLLPVCVDGLWCPSVTWTVSVCLCAWLLSDLSGSYHCLFCGMHVGSWVYISLWEPESRAGWQQLGLTHGWRSVWRIFACLGTTMGIWAVLIEQLEMTGTVWVMAFIKCRSLWSAVCYLLEMRQGELAVLSCLSLPFSPSPDVAPVTWSWTAAGSFLQPSATHPLQLPVCTPWPCTFAQLGFVPAQQNLVLQ